MVAGKVLGAINPLKFLGKVLDTLRKFISGTVGKIATQAEKTMLEFYKRAKLKEIKKKIKKPMETLTLTQSALVNFQSFYTRGYWSVVMTTNVACPALIEKIDGICGKVSNPKSDAGILNKINKAHVPILAALEAIVVPLKVMFEGMNFIVGNILNPLDAIVDFFDKLNPLIKVLDKITLPLKGIMWCPKIPFHNIEKLTLRRRRRLLENLGETKFPLEQNFDRPQPLQNQQLFDGAEGQKKLRVGLDKIVALAKNGILEDTLKLLELQSAQQEQTPMTPQITSREHEEMRDFMTNKLLQHAKDGTLHDTLNMLALESTEQQQQQQQQQLQQQQHQQQMTSRGARRRRRRRRRRSGFLKKIGSGLKKAVKKVGDTVKKVGSNLKEAATIVFTDPKKATQIVSDGVGTLVSKKYREAERDCEADHVGEFPGKSDDDALPLPSDKDPTAFFGKILDNIIWKREAVTEAKDTYHCDSDSEDLAVLKQCSIPEPVQQFCADEGDFCQCDGFIDIGGHELRWGSQLNPTVSKGFLCKPKEFGPRPPAFWETEDYDDKVCANLHCECLPINDIVLKAEADTKLLTGTTYKHDEDINDCYGYVQMAGVWKGETKYWGTRLLLAHKGGKPTLHATNAASAHQRWRIPLGFRSYYAPTLKCNERYFEDRQGYVAAGATDFFCRCIDKKQDLHWSTAKSTVRANDKTELTKDATHVLLTEDGVLEETAAHVERTSYEDCMLVVTQMPLVKNPDVEGGSTDYHVQNQDTCNLYGAWVRRYSYWVDALEEQQKKDCKPGKIWKSIWKAFLKRLLQILLWQGEFVNMELCMNYWVGLFDKVVGPLMRLFDGLIDIVLKALRFDSIMAPIKKKLSEMFEIITKPLKNLDFNIDLQLKGIQLPELSFPSLADLNILKFIPHFTGLLDGFRLQLQLPDVELLKICKKKVPFLGKTEELVESGCGR